MTPNFGLVIVPRKTIVTAIRKLSGINVMGECVQCLQRDGHKPNCVVSVLRFCLKQGAR
jgi:hypothetical protein